MTIYQNVLADRIIGATASTSPGSSWTAVNDVPTLVTNARTANLPLFLLPGVYGSSQIVIDSSAGGGNPLILSATPGTVTIFLSGSAPNLVSIVSVSNVIIENIRFDCNGVVLTDTSQTSSLINVSNNIRPITIRNCYIENSSAAGICYWNNVYGSIAFNQIYNCSTGVFCLDSNATISNNFITYCTNNGALVWTSSDTGNLSIVSQNYIANISANAGGTGQNGNGINVFRAGGVHITGNTIYTCAFSAIRINSGSGCIVTGNYCYNLNEAAIYFEAPGSSDNLTGGIFSNNIITSAGSGIQCVNSGLYGDGISRRITISGNQISNITSNYISAEGGYTLGQGILVEGGCVVIGNTIENVPKGAILLGTNNATNHVAASGNLILSCPLGIGYSANSSALGILISGNMISNYTNNSDPTSSSYPHSGAIVSVTYNGSEYRRDAATGGKANNDYGNVGQIAIGTLTIGLNQAT